MEQVRQGRKNLGRQTPEFVPVGKREPSEDRLPLRGDLDQHFAVVELMADAPVYYQIHVAIALVLFCLWPFTRLVHVFSAPLGYITRPYIVYRSRDAQLGTRRPRRGWERVG